MATHRFVPNNVAPSSVPGSLSIEPTVRADGQPSRSSMRLLVLLQAAILFGFGSTRARAQGSLETDKEALVALYDATDGANWANNLNWKTDQALSTWSGVTTGAGGRVTGLNLSFNSLSGTIPTELGDLTALQTLNFANNSGLTGGIPTQLGSLTALRTLDLSNNSGLTGGIPTQPGGLDRARGPGPQRDWPDRRDSDPAGKVDRAQLPGSQQE